MAAEVAGAGDGAGAVCARAEDTEAARVTAKQIRREEDNGFSVFMVYGNCGFVAQTAARSSVYARI